MSFVVRAVMIVAALSLAGAACARQRAVSVTDRLHACRTDEGPTDAYCGTLAVYENRPAQTGRTIDLRIIVLPALSSDAEPDPLFFLAGGPGQGAAEMARPIREMFRRVQANRDIVLVDQRGTGKSNPLNCDSDGETLQALNEGDDKALEKLKQCLAALKGDARYYTTTIAMDDLDEVREYLGYEKINIYGGSYGTRAALVYLRQHEARVRSMIIDGVAPTDMRLPMFFARDAQRALDFLLADCEKDEACRTRFPDLAARLRALVARLDASPVKTRLVHPRTGLAEDVTINGRFVVSALFGALYSPLSASLVPPLIDRADQGDFQGMLALAMMNDGLAQNMSVGMQFSVLCAEDFRRIKREEAERESAPTIFGRHLLELRLQACEMWPKGAVDPAYYEPVRSSVPVLIFSGELDPVTPPSWGEMAKQTLSNARHIIAPATGHGVIGSGCGMRMAHQFIDSADPNAVDDGCTRALKRPPFFLTPSGPDPGGRREAGE